MIIYFFHLKLA